MRIDCGVCSAEDKVWAARKSPGGQAIYETLEVGTNLVQCRGCKTEGYVDLDVTCRNCQGHDLWRWPNRSMVTNTRRWMCRDCYEVTETHSVAVMYVSTSTLPTVKSRGRDTPNCGTCSHSTTMYTRDRMLTSYCTNPAGSHQNIHQLHKQPKAERTVQGVNNTTFFQNIHQLHKQHKAEEQVNANGEAWEPRMRSFKELRKMEVAKLMAQFSISKEAAKLMFKNKMEAVDDEAIFCF